MKLNNLTFKVDYIFHFNLKFLGTLINHHNIKSEKPGHKTYTINSYKRTYVYRYWFT